MSPSTKTKTTTGADIPAPEFLEVGKKAPAFTAVDQDGNSVSLSDYEGKKVALCFYVHDGTKACDNELLELESNLSQFKKQKINLLAVSQDDQASHAKNAKKLNLHFPILADPDHTIIKKYKVWGKKNMYGNISEGVHRSAYIIDEKGVIIVALKRVTSTKASEQILAAYSNLSS